MKRPLDTQKACILEYTSTHKSEVWVCYTAGSAEDWRKFSILKCGAVPSLPEPTHRRKYHSSVGWKKIKQPISKSLSQSNTYSPPPCSQGLGRSTGRVSHQSCEGCGFDSHLSLEIFFLQDETHDLYTSVIGLMLHVCSLHCRHNPTTKRMVEIEMLCCLFWNPCRVPCSRFKGYRRLSIGSTGTGINAANGCD